MALIKKKWKSIVPIIPVGQGCESANGSANPFWHVQHKPQCHSGHLPILSACTSLFSSPLLHSLSLTESRLMIIHFFFFQNITLLLLSTVTGLDCEFADPWWVYSLSCSLWHEIFWEGFCSAATLVQCLKVWRYDVKTDLNVGHVNMPPPFLH